VGYDMIRDYEDIGTLPVDPIGMPAAHLMYFETIVAFDHFKQEVTLLSIAQNGEADIEKLEVHIRGVEQELTQPVGQTTAWTQSATEDEFIARVERLKHHITEGDIFQVVPSLRLSATYRGETFAVYQRLREINPSPYMFYIDFEDYVVLGASPESLISVRGQKIETNPIAGTRKRGLTKEEDATIAQGLKDDPKELAEHYMLVDLSRNDVGTISEIGSVKVDRFLDVEYYSHVMHLVSVVTGELRPEENCFSALKRCLPAGTVSGAPKIRAMQLINDTEQLRRNVYAGCVGYISVSGAMDMALAIRTLVYKDERIHIQAGAGVVEDSVPKLEYEECMNKARALLEVFK
ncbi:MAG: anthranilate synthase component I family protein, partial [Bacilli bacterium]